MPTSAALEIRQVSVDRILVDGAVMFQDHWAEVAQNRDVRRFGLDELRLRAMEQNGDLFVLAAYEGETLIGYSVCLIGNHLHDVNTLYAKSDALFVHKSHRRQGVGGRLVVATEREAKKRGASVMIWHAMVDTELDTRLASSRRYIAQDVTYTRRL